MCRKDTCNVSHFYRTGSPQGRSTPPLPLFLRGEFLEGFSDAVCVMLLLHASEARSSRNFARVRPLNTSFIFIIDSIGLFACISRAAPQPVTSFPNSVDLFFLLGRGWKTSSLHREATTCPAGSSSSSSPPGKSVSLSVGYVLQYSLPWLFSY